MLMCNSVGKIEIKIHFFVNSTSNFHLKDKTSHGKNNFFYKFGIKTISPQIHK